MKKITKVALVFAIIFAIVGTICIIASFAMGLTWDRLTGMVTEGKFNFAFEHGDVHEDEKGVVKIPDEKKGDVMNFIDVGFKHYCIGDGVCSYIKTVFYAVDDFDITGGVPGVREPLNHAVVSDRNSGLTKLLDPIHKPIDAAGAIQEAICRMQM